MIPSEAQMGEGQCRTIQSIEHSDAEKRVKGYQDSEY